MREFGLSAAGSLPKQPEPTAHTPHVVRLHGPWQCELYKSSAVMPPNNSEAPSGDTTEILRIKLPVDWCAFFGERTYDSMVWRRSFGRPTNLSHRERVELVISSLRADVLVRLNEVQIEPVAQSDANARFEVTNQLNTRNQLALEVRTPGGDNQNAQPRGELDEPLPAGPFGQVCLEILTSG